MKNRTALVVISLILALGTAGAAYLWLSTQNARTAKTVEKIEILIAKEDIKTGAEIKETMIEKIKVPKEQVPAGAYSDPKDVVGRFAKSSILKGEPFPSQRLYSDSDQLLSMKLEPGFRAFSISMTRYSAVADMIKPGDRVDIFVFLKEIAGNEAVIRPDMAQVLLQNVEVLAVRQETQPDSQKPEEVADLYAVTVAVPVKAVEKLILGEETGLLKIALRPINEKETYASYGVVWQELLLDQQRNLRDFEAQYGTVKGTDVLTSVLPTTPEVSDSPSSAGTDQQVTEAAVPPKAPVVKPKTSSYTMYTVQAGDTLMNISRKFFNGSASHYDDIMRINGLSDPAIKPGQRLKIPRTGR